MWRSVLRRAGERLEAVLCWCAVVSHNAVEDLKRHITALLAFGVFLMSSMAQGCLQFIADSRAQLLSAGC